MVSDTDASNPTVPIGTLTSVPNMVTLARIGLTIACFVALSLSAFGPALVLFLVAAGTDWIDGWWARKFNQVSQIGRVLDPFADKLLICGTFVFLASVPESGIAAWMAVLIMGREILVTALRSFVEAQGGDFSAQWLGKQKMAWQCIAATLSLLLLSGWWTTWHDKSAWLIGAAVWICLILTVWSGWGYVLSALQMARSSHEAPTSPNKASAEESHRRTQE